MGVSTDVWNGDFDTDRPYFGQLLLACLDVASREEAELRLRKAETSRPIQFAILCVGELSDSSRPVVARQLAGLLLANALALGYALADAWVEEVPDTAKTRVHELMLNAITSEERAVWSSAAAAISKLAIIEIPVGLWPELMPCLHRWAKSDRMQNNDRLHEASLLVIKCLAEAWPLERLMPAMMITAAEGIAPAFPHHVRTVAAETLLQILESDPEYSPDVIPRCPDIVIEAILSGCQAGDILQLQLASISCLDQLCAKFLPYIVSHRERIFAVGLSALRMSPMQLRGAAMDLWTTLAANQFLSMTSEDDRIGLHSCIIPELLQLVLGAVCSEDMNETNSVEIPARSLFSAMCVASDQPYSDELAAFACTHWRSPDIRFRRAALLAIGALAPSSLHVSMDDLLEAMQCPSICGVACWAVGRTLQFAPSTISAEAKLQIFTLSLESAGDPEHAEDFQHVLSQLIESLTITPDQYVEISRRFIQFALNCPQVARGIALGVLCLLIKRAPADCKPHFGDTLSSLLVVSRELQLMDARREHPAQTVFKDTLERRICWDGTECTFAEFKTYYGKTAVRNWHMSPKSDHATVIDGVARCLHAITDGVDVLTVTQIAEPLITYYIANLQATCSQGAGLDQDSLYGIAALGVKLGPAFINVAGPYSELWPLLLHGIGAPAASRSDLASWDFPQSCEAALVAFCLILEALGKDFENCWYVENSRAVLQRVLSVWYLPGRLRCLAMAALGLLVRSVGCALQSIPQVFQTMNKVVSSLSMASTVHPKFSSHGLSTLSALSSNDGKRASSLNSEHLSKQACSHGLLTTALQVYTHICSGLRETQTLTVVKDNVHTMLTLAATCLETPKENGMQEAALGLIVQIVALFPEYGQALDQFKGHVGQLPETVDGGSVTSLEIRMQRCMLTK